jgi:23S rRNA (adenine2503-C2)-methyltransferase
MGCSFCASGLEGLFRNLYPSEMLAQVMKAGTDNGIRVSNIVLMGMGEPLDNFDNVKRFLELVSEPEGLGIGYRHISLSTSGVVPGIYKLGELNLPITLSISLHAPFDEIRSEMMKVNRRWNINELITACKDYQKITGRRISFEYAMIKGKNDTEACALRLAEILKGILCHVNLIPANPVKENTYEKSDKRALQMFADRLNCLGINTTVRRTLGSDIDASCGQLRRKFENKGGETNEGLQ